MRKGYWARLCISWDFYDAAIGAGGDLVGWAAEFGDAVCLK